MRMHFGKDLLDDAQTLKLQYGRCCIDYRHDHMTWTWCMRVSHIVKKQKIKRRILRMLYAKMVGILRLENKRILKILIRKSKSKIKCIILVNI